MMQSVWPNIEPASPRFPDMYAAGYLTTNASGIPYPFNTFDKPTYIYDPFNPAARGYLADALFAGYGQYGVTSYVRARRYAFPVCDRALHMCVSHAGTGSTRMSRK